MMCSWTTAYLILEEKGDCTQLSEEELAKILGPAFNPRYMSVHIPNVIPIKTTNELEEKIQKRKHMDLRVYLEEDYVHVISEQPAWEYQHVTSEDLKITENGRRKKREILQWQCKEEWEWIDLGVDYFPRYIQSAKCCQKKCWFGHYTCQPKAFSVKLLRRRRSKCTWASSGSTIGVAGMPPELRALWVWEERAINFCCACNFG